MLGSALFKHSKLTDHHLSSTKIAEILILSLNLPKSSKSYPLCQVQVNDGRLNHDRDWQYLQENWGEIGEEQPHWQSEQKES